MKKACKAFLLLLLDITGINLLCRVFNRNKAIILYYHGICNEDFTLLTGYDERHIPKSSFRKQLEYLRRNGYMFVTMTELVESLENKTAINKRVVLTFDDGFKNVINNAYPIMKEFSAKGCFFLISDLIGTDRLVWTDYIETIIRNQPQGDFHFVFQGKTIKYTLNDKISADHAMWDIKAKLRSLPDKARLSHLEQFMNLKLKDIPDEFLMASWEQIKGLDFTILEIGGHTRSHPNCENLVSDLELESEILGSKTDIEKNIGCEVTHFCYPAGSYNDMVVQNVKEYGYKSAVTTNPGFVDQNSDLYRLNRLGISGNLRTFKADVSGSYQALRKVLYKMGFGSVNNEYAVNSEKK
jgi:peptidoglycan/xylan/chitin deacetylase (PgdA/CDA1 family)